MGGSSGHRTWPIKEEIDAGILPFACRLCRNSVGIGRARELAREALVRWDLHKHAGLAELIITELTTNALRHGVGQIVIGLSYSGGVHRLPVRDVPGRGAPPRLRPGGTGLCGPSRRVPGAPALRSFPANATWLTLAAIAHNLLRAAGSLASLACAKACGATLRRDLIDIAVRTARHGHGHITLHLPEGWHRKTEWMNLFEAACGPPTRAA
jgi:hypothetical protein